MSATMLFVFLMYFVTEAKTLVMDELISARCQAKCLSDFEANAMSKGVSRKQLKHTLISMCKADEMCNSCARPCREPFDNLISCFNSACKDATQLPDCYRSCQFMIEITTTKPGKCPRLETREALQSGNFASECTVSCTRDGDCGESQKCCQAGCGHLCSIAEFEPEGLLPVPTDVAIAERKRGRSATIRWVMSRMRPEHEATFANLYVTQWKWGRRPESAFMTKWQTISVKNKVYTILKHLLGPGLYYRFRVAAVNVNGSQGFSLESDPFRLSRHPSAPSPPREVQRGTHSFYNGFVHQEIHWMPPKTDLPIVEYEISWFENSANIYNVSAMPLALRQKGSKPATLSRSFDYDVDDDERLLNGGGFHEAVIQTKLVPGAEMFTIITGLKANTAYIVDVRAISEADGERLPGDKASIAFRTPMAPLLTDVFDDEDERDQTTPRASFDLLIAQGRRHEHLDAADPLSSNAPRILRARISKATATDNTLKATLSWDADSGSLEATGKAKFLLTWWPTICVSQAVHDPLFEQHVTAIVENTSFELRDLRFGCQYAATISVYDGRRSGHKVEISFETPLCSSELAKPEERSLCPAFPFDVPLQPERLVCRLLRDQSEVDVKSKSDLAVAECSFKPPRRSESSVTGYQLTFGRTLSTVSLHVDDWTFVPTVDRATVVSKILKQEPRHFQLPSLVPNAQYVVQLKAISSAGVGPPTHTSFLTPAVLVRRKPDDRVNLLQHSSSASTLELANSDERSDSSEVSLSEQSFARREDSGSLSSSSAVTTHVAPFVLVSVLVLLLRFRQR